MIASFEMAPGNSLIIKLPYKLCDKCTDVLSRWHEPLPYDGGWSQYGNNWSYPANEQSFTRDTKDPRWAWKGQDLKNSALYCQFCRFIKESLDASPWMTYQENDYVTLASAFVGSKHISPERRDELDNQSSYSNHKKSEYGRYHRPRLQVYNMNSNNETCRYAEGEFTYILPLTQSMYDWEENSFSQTFNGRIVDEHANFALVQHWLTTCQKKHVRRASYMYGYEQPEIQECAPKPRSKINCFRLIDVQKRCVIEADSQLELEYAALSYVWGHAKRLLLRSDNLGTLSEPGALSHENEHVPTTFRDAFKVAENLNIKYIWIDALCILQDDEGQLVEHMNSMDSIYSSATLTIVSDTESADTGIPGVGFTRGPPQAIFNHGGKDFISSKRTFGTSLYDSCWESRAWCLQEKVFSKRLLIFTETQTFFHCTCATWFEDTILEAEESSYGSVYIAERSDPSRKQIRSPSYTAYEAHRTLFGRNFWSLVEIYTRRQLSFESDSIRAFSGILKSIEPKYGSAIWGVPQFTFARGLTWLLSLDRTLRREGFPSWSWAGWRGNTGSRLYFPNYLKAYGWLDELWELDWYYYRLNEKGDYELTLVDTSKDGDDIFGKPGGRKDALERRSAILKGVDPFDIPPRPSAREWGGNLFDRPIPSKAPLPPKSDDEGDDFDASALPEPEDFFESNADKIKASKNTSSESTTTAESNALKTKIGDTMPLPADSVKISSDIASSSLEATSNTSEITASTPRNDVVAHDDYIYDDTSDFWAIKPSTPGTHLNLDSDAEVTTIDSETGKETDVAGLPIETRSQAKASPLPQSKLNTEANANEPKQSKPSFTTASSKSPIVQNQKPHISSTQRPTSPLPKHTAFRASSTQEQLIPPRPRGPSSRTLISPWRLPDHPGSPSFETHPIPPLNHSPAKMPPLSHILRFYTSVAKLHIDAEPDDSYYQSYHASQQPKKNNQYAIRIPGNDTYNYALGHISPDESWQGKGKEAIFVYLSRGFYPPSDSDWGGREVILNILLLEPATGGQSNEGRQIEDTLMRRVTMICGVSLGQWIAAKPEWKLINLA